MIPDSSDVSTPSSSSVSPIWILAIPLVGLFVWLIWKLRLSSENRNSISSRILARFRFKPLSRQEDLVTSVDQFMLANFGTAAKWWHAKLVESKLIEKFPALATSISNLLTNYELVRYTAGAKISFEQLNHSSETLSKLVRIRNETSKGYTQSDSE